MIRKIGLISYILTDISRRKGNQASKFGQLIECNMKNIFLKKSYAKCGEKLFLVPFHEILGNMCIVIVC